MERKESGGGREMPEDVAELYSWANLHGAKYQDFSAIRAENRERIRRRAEAKREEQREAETLGPVALLRPLVEPSLAEPEQSVDAATADRDRQFARWFAFRDAMAGEVAVPIVLRAPVLAVFSLAECVGKSSLLATLGRALAASNERVLLVDSTTQGLLPFFFGACERYPGHLMRFNPTARTQGAAIQLVTLDPESLGTGREGGGEVEQRESPHRTLAGEIARLGQEVERVLIDLPTASVAVMRRLMRLAPEVLVPLVPSIQSVVSVEATDAFFERHRGSGSRMLPFYLLSQFNAASALDRDLRAALQERLGERLLPFTLSHSAEVSAALAEGRTVIDSAPQSELAEEFRTLAKWARSRVRATTGQSGIQRSER